MPAGAAASPAGGQPSEAQGSAGYHEMGVSGGGPVPGAAVQAPERAGLDQSKVH